MTSIFGPGPGRTPTYPGISSVRELTQHDIDSFKQGRDPVIQRYRDSHHQMARLFAMGLRVSEVAREMGYSIGRVSVHHNNPIFRELIAGYSKVNDEVTRDSIASYNALILANGMKAERKIADRLDDDEENDAFSTRELLSIARDAADRVGLSKRSIQTNISVDFAAMLDRALDRTQRAKQPQLSLVHSSGHGSDDQLLDIPLSQDSNGSKVPPQTTTIRPTVPLNRGTFLRRA